MGLLLKEGHRILQFSFKPTSKVSLFVNEGKKGTFFLCEIHVRKQARPAFKQLHGFPLLRSENKDPEIKKRTKRPDIVSPTTLVKVPVAVWRNRVFEA